MSTKKILIIRFSSIGDIVLTSPIIRCLKKQTEAEIHFLTKEAFVPIVSSNPYLHKIFAIRKDVEEVLLQLKREQYDYVIDLHKNLRTFKTRIALGVRFLTFDKINKEKWLMVNFKWNRLPKLHIVDRYFQAVKSLGVKNDGAGLDYFIPKKEEVKPWKLLAKKHKPNYLVFVIGAAHVTKQLPKHKIVAICQKLNLPIILIGGTAEKKLGDEIVENTGQHILNTCGQFSIHQSASVIRQSTFVITPDTGMMHIAAAFGKKIISVWGNTIPEFGMTPYYGDAPNLNTIVEVKKLSCRPCSKIGYATCPKSHFKCMNEIKVEKIIELIV